MKCEFEIQGGGFPAEIGPGYWLAFHAPRWMALVLALVAPGIPVLALAQQTIITEHKQRVLDMADALLARETLDAEQVKRLSAGLPLDEPAASAGTPSAPAPRDTKPAKERPSPTIVPTLPPRPVTHE